MDTNKNQNTKANKQLNTALDKAINTSKDYIIMQIMLKDEIGVR